MKNVNPSTVEVLLWPPWLLAFGAGGCLFWTDAVDTLPGSGLVGWCLESVFFLIRTQPQFLFRTHCGFGNRLRGDSEKPRRSTKRNIGSCKAQSATTLSMKVKPVKKYGHSCAFARISAKCLVIHSIFTAVVLLTTFVATQLCQCLHQSVVASCTRWSGPL